MKYRAVGDLAPAGDPKVEARRELMYLFGRLTKLLGEDEKLPEQFKNLLERSVAK